jgi:predicted nucleic acid-binding protein
VIQVLFDTNVLLDAVLAREPFLADAAFLLEAVEAGQLVGIISATTITDIYYLVGRQTKSKTTAITAVMQLMALMEVGMVDRTILEQAISLNFADFEDAIQVACAIALGVDAIVTRDLDGFAESPVLVLSPADLRSRLMSSQ